MVSVSAMSLSEVVFARSGLVSLLVSMRLSFTVCSRRVTAGLSAVILSLTVIFEHRISFVFILSLGFLPLYVFPVVFEVGSSNWLT